MSSVETKSDLSSDFLLVIRKSGRQKNKKIVEKIKQISKTKEKSDCKICEKKLSSKYNLMQHMKRLHPNEISLKVYSCDQCDLKFIKKSSLIKHLKSKHRKEKEIKYECDLDGKIFNTKAKLYSHLTKCQVEKCGICNKKVKFLDSHMKQIHASENQKIQCPICLKTCKNQHSLNIHLKTHNKRNQCQICGRKFALKYQLKEHQKVHENQFAFRCEKCQKNFNCSSNLKKHLKTHNQNRIKNLKCNRCDYSTDNKHCLARHLKTHNKKREKNLKCNQCDYKTDHKGNLKIHMQIHNSNRAKFPCLYCNYEATRRNSLKIHLKTKHDPNQLNKL
ncbi:hypothetical protein PVAND_017384 [Polypedilum vanderplanki]|uniref:C2H2-type domain-containing protein n=1 Tax=Polypedilum vanderplanki TaxID=319348 RepID=A0A9J6BHX5_POLVA|nr:hypothetical protein PVAND_017384 [Polypedilum vanderplanki]